MIVGIGVDICQISRWRAMVERHPGAVDKVLTPREAAGSPASQAARFAAKEALSKALGGPGRTSWHEVEVVADRGGRPQIEVRGAAAGRLVEAGVGRLHLSLSHDGDLAVAMVVAESAHGAH
ncbi:MAG: holo-ACP synthase [Propionibacteriaceae bacterium]|jgi:holo-[acyl-carrier protein] synthase|nr:holo-ACP synthase [Propionibacteriaceae bacterium]